MMGCRLGLPPSSSNSLEDVYKRARGLYGSFSRPVEKPAHVDP